MTTNEIMKIDTNSMVMINPRIVLKEEEDNWGILYDPDTDLSFTINTVSVFLWKQLTTKRNIKYLIEKVMETFANVPDEVEADVIELIKQLNKKEFVSIETENKATNRE